MMSIFSYISLLEKLSIASSIYHAEGVTGLSLQSLKDNWSPEYQNTNSGGVPDPEGDVTWNFK